MSRLVTVLAIASLLAPELARAKCARTEQVPKILTTRDTKIPDDGGILVGWSNEVYGSGRARAGDGDPSDQPSWIAREGKTKIALERVSLAPGLSVYKPARGKGAIALDQGRSGPGVKSTTLATFTRDPKAAANKMTAPAVSAITVSTDQDMRWAERHAKATLDAAPPEAAAALITYAVTASGNVPIAFVTLPDTHDKLRALDAFEDAGHCGSVPPSSRPPSSGERVVFAWVDAFGRLSPTSKPITTKER